MWYLFKMLSFILIFGTTHGAYRNRRSMNPEENMNISQIISYWGYPDEEYDITTEDGYILGLYRIPYGKTNSDNSSAQRLVVYLQHGLLTSASSWISNLPNSSLGFLLADAGYDVWMGNSRGTTWSRKHLYLETNSKEFWAFSFDEMAKYDLPASIDFIVKQTQQEEIFYVGHSQGTTIAFITFSTIPIIAGRIKIFFAFAPVFSIKYSKSPLIKMAYNWKSVIKAFSGNKDFLPNTSFKRFVGSQLCPLKIFGKICHDILFMISGYDQKNLNMVEEAFDKTQHTFMIKSLSKLGIERNFLNLIKNIYNKTTVNIIINEPYGCLYVTEPSRNICSKYAPLESDNFPVVQCGKHECVNCNLEW
ncbi:lipase member J isoform X3 [Vicugna pacos]|uniref:Lipase member J isoform X3 n=1 Tax=Vicugna pacos TaxID=30538 RepID=A0ABM5E3C6_VICPA